MLDKQTARTIASDYLKRVPLPGDEIVIVDKFTIEKPYGWVFFYNSKRYLDTSDVRYMLAGNGPVLIERSTGSIYQLGTAHDVKYFLGEYEKGRLRPV